MEAFWTILTMPDNIPIVAMLGAVVFLLGVWLRQALRHDRLLQQGGEEAVAEEMRK